MMNSFSTVDVKGGYFEIRMDLDWLRRAFESPDGLEDMIKHFLDVTSYLTAKMLYDSTKGRGGRFRMTALYLVEWSYVSLLIGAQLYRTKERMEAIANDQG